MHTIGGGTVRYVDITVLPCREAPEPIGQCDSPGALEVIRGDRVTESFVVSTGDMILVADGAVVAPGTELIAHVDWRYLLRATIAPAAEAVAHWIDGSDDALRLELCARGDGAVLAAYELDRSARMLVESGSIVRRGDRLAELSRLPRAWHGRVGIELLRALLDARIARGAAALVAPCDGTVESIDGPTIALRTRDGRRLRLRAPRRGYLIVEGGDAVRAGDPLTSGERTHQALLHAWGEDRLAEHLLDELEAICGPEVPRVYWALAARAMLGWRRIREPGDTGLARGAVVSREQLEQHQRAARSRGSTATAAPALRGFGAMASEIRPLPRGQHRE